MTWPTIEDRAREIAGFLNLDEAFVLAELKKGFWYHHAKVAEDFRRAGPRTDAELLEWYRRTDAYIWELSAYHAEPSFNYAGMCEGIATHLVHLEKLEVLCLGDGVGDLSLTLARSGLSSTYHDLDGSRTCEFAMYRARAPQAPLIHTMTTVGWTPMFGGFPSQSRALRFDAVVALDFFEHLPNVEEWVQAVARGLKPGGIFLAQNAFNIGSGPEGSIPCHLVSNDHWEKDWDALLERCGLVRSDPWNGWWRKP